ncbi:rho GTPase-activating protein 19-like isoform X2 [Panonychus citri]|nr:rho GTPase-activating protein 19-like isoform X2 [Panonychus citri]XP_053201605.1 rho GTPase-activating protein 19-like isoform X2 [Panonychus citri]XP_053201606.1 rho GTPase-activating protein 19-like isoform X2 [Panonychus citri]XP_053201607.1 rho GTPase-activating protein 19-like isoform X2 [Panonychus citri]XP_053201608.1 rho GTPase-activating protein 19-like isoform X2 [Panonychus citri]XP_053201609.1 rho GTPase-activating protein 19-like isoform X2 [Panonychus citri]
MNQLIDFIAQDSNIVQEGIFRRCGSLVRQQELKSKLTRGTKVNLEDGQYNVHDCANVLKTFLSELSQPLLTDIFYKINCEIPDITEQVTNSGSLSPSKKNKKLKKLQLLLLLLPANVRKFVRDLLLLLNKTAAQSEYNKMNSRNLSTLFAPHLLFPKEMTASEIQQHLIILTDELKFMIDNVNIIFDPPKELAIDAKREYQKLESGDATDDVVDTVLTFCSRDNIPKQPETAKHLAELYAFISSMPETPKKKSLIKQFNRQNGGITPLSVKKDDSVKLRASNMMKAVGKGIRKGLNLFPGSINGTPKTPKLSKSCDQLSGRATPCDTRPSWSSETNLNESDKQSFQQTLDTVDNSIEIDSNDVHTPQRNPKKFKLSE